MPKKAIDGPKRRLKVQLSTAPQEKTKEKLKPDILSELEIKNTKEMQSGSQDVLKDDIFSDLAAIWNSFAEGTEFKVAGQLHTQFEEKNDPRKEQIARKAFQVVYDYLLAAKHQQVSENANSEIKSRIENTVAPPPAGPLPTQTATPKRSITQTNVELSIAPLVRMVPAPPSKIDYDALDYRALAIATNQRLSELFPNEGHVRYVIVNEFAPLVDRLYRNSTPTQLQGLADLVVSFLRLLPDKRSFMEDVYHYLPTLRGVLERASPKRTPWTLSLSALAVITSIAADALGDGQLDSHLGTKLRLRGCCYYAAVINSTVLNNFENIEVLNQAFNNLAAALAKLGRLIEDGQSKEFNNHLEDLKLAAISTVQTNRKGMASKQKSEEFFEILDAFGLRVLFPRRKISDPQQLQNRLDLWKMVSGGMTTDSYSLAYSNAINACLRALSGRDSQDRTASGFFNAGVVLARMRTSTFNSERAQVALNALGLFWSLELTGDVRRALRYNDGEDCLLNLVGSLVSLQNEGVEYKETPRFMAALAGLLNKDFLSDTIRLRIANSLAKEPKLIRPLVDNDIKKAVVSFINSTFGSSGENAEISAKRSAEILYSEFVDLLSTSQLKEAQLDFVELLETLGNISDDPATHLQSFKSEVTGPLRWLVEIPGVISIEGWQQEINASIAAPEEVGKGLLVFG